MRDFTRARPLIQDFSPLLFFFFYVDSTGLFREAVMLLLLVAAAVVVVVGRDFDLLNQLAVEADL